MIGCCSFCPCFGISGDADDDLGRSNLDPVLLISGIGGSILHSKRRRRGFQTRVWVRIFLADLEFKKKLWSIYNPKTGLLYLPVFLVWLMRKCGKKSGKWSTESRVFVIFIFGLEEREWGDSTQLCEVVEHWISLVEVCFFVYEMMKLKTENWFFDFLLIFSATKQTLTWSAFPVLRCY